MIFLCYVYIRKSGFTKTITQAGLMTLSNFGILQFYCFQHASSTPTSAPWQTPKCLVEYFQTGNKLNQ